jgi:alanyl-tRNA synthetase
MTASGTHFHLEIGACLGNWGDPHKIDIMTSAQIRQSFLDFFREKKHTMVPSSSLLPDAPNLLFTNAGMNQFVPIFLGQQKPTWKPARVADTQKCIRAGGKHNDLEDVGLDTYHHTFFEMLGNWSFGDYFKKEAIDWAWELIVDRWKFPAQRLYATVYKPGPNEPSEFDQEAHDHWARLFQEADLDPKIHVVSSGKADNFWMMGDTGPCGPCSELHVDLTPDGDTRGSLVNKDDPRCIEIWNLVFIQFNANPDGSFAPLPQRHVDTGMGFERVTAIIRGTNNLTDFSGTVSNYETDIFRPIFDELEKLSGEKYKSTLPKSGVAHETRDEKIDIAFRVIADHVRALTFAIADGIIPSNEGRGYVLRRILRRAVRYGRTLGFREPFLTNPAAVVAVTMREVFPELRAKLPLIEKILRREEESFNKTLDKGIALFEKAMQGRGLYPRGALLDFVIKDDAASTDELLEALEISDNPDGTRNVRVKGDLAFRLYDTYGFPLDLTQLMAREYGLSVDVDRFNELMEEQRNRARAARQQDFLKAGNYPATKFVGYDQLSIRTKLVMIEGEYVAPMLNVYFGFVEESPLYAEMGGQVGDQGRIVRDDGSYIDVTNTFKRGSTFFLELGDQHKATGVLPPNVAPPFVASGGENVTVEVDAERRIKIQGHHTATHLLHWALHQVVSKDAAQKGSYVGPDKLTFDFSSAALSPEQKRDVEKLVNEKIAESASVSWTEIPYAEAKQRKEIQQFFGEKYGDKVRVLQIGGEPKKLNGYSMELCGGTHVRSTSEIGPFRIVKEEAIAAGTRRIEAVAGDAARVWAREEAARQQERFETLSRKKTDLAPLPVFTETAQTGEMLKQIDARASYLEKLDVDVREWEKKHAKEAEADVRSRGAQIGNELASSNAGEKFCVTNIPDADGKLLQAVADALKQKFDGPIVLAGAKDGNVALVAVVPKPLTSKFQANKIIQQLAPIVGGKGGGRPESAQGGGTDAGKIDNLLAEARRLLS